MFEVKREGKGYLSIDLKVRKSWFCFYKKPDDWYFQMDLRHHCSVWHGKNLFQWAWQYITQSKCPCEAYYNNMPQQEINWDDYE